MACMQIRLLPKARELQRSSRTKKRGRGLRNFPNRVEAVADMWARTAIDERAWKVGEDTPIGESNPFYVQSGSLGGVAKPREAKRPWPRAAIEKICSDLAYELKLPVPPVTLWRASKKLKLPVRLLAVSLFPFDSAPTAWGVIEEVPDYIEHLLPHLRAPSSALVAFDSWVGNRDRKNVGNLLFSEEESGVIRVAYINFSESLFFSHPSSSPDNIDPVGAYPDASQLDVQVLESTIGAIERLPSSRIKEIVSRVPEDFLTATQKQRILSGLLKRQSTLRSSLVSFFGELQWSGHA